MQVDFNGDGQVDVSDLGIVGANWGKTLPSGIPAGMTNDPPTTAGIPDLYFDTTPGEGNPTSSVLSLPNYFADLQTPPANMTYTIVQNTNPSPSPRSLLIPLHSN